MLVRFSKLLLVFVVFCLFTLIAFNNITDLHINWPFLQNVLTMDSVFPDSTFKWRAIQNHNIQAGAYLLVIAWEALVALLLFLGLFRLLFNIKDSNRFHAAKGLATFGLTLGFVLFGLGFMVIASEWFGMWQSTKWNANQSASHFILLIGLVLISLQQRELP